MQWRSKRYLAILVDPDKPLQPSLAERVARLQQMGLQADMVLLGGSTGVLQDEQVFVQAQRLSLPVWLFPGNAQQLSSRADGLLLPIVLSGRNAEMLIGRHVRAAREIRALSLPVVPLGYVLLDGGRLSSTMRVTETMGIAQSDEDLVVRTAMAGELTGVGAIYLEAGSGALQPVRPSLIRAVREAVELPLFVGGGLRSREMVEQAWQSGADVVVIGNGLEV